MIPSTVSQYQEKLATGEYTAEALSEAVCANIAKRNPELNAFLEVFDDVVQQARSADAMRREGRATPLTGIPIAVKDNILIAEKHVSASSKILEGYRAPYDATVIAKLKRAGAVLIGRTNCDEFAMGSSTENSAYGVTKNPHDLTRVPGGSSGGSAAAVASGMVPIAIGSDTGGSIRQPASFCGVVGLKPTYGSVSRHGLIAMGSSLDVIGPFAHSVADARLVFEMIRGIDPFDSTSLPARVVPVQQNARYTVGVPRSFLTSGVDTHVMRAFETSLEKLAHAGCEIVDIDLPYIKHSLAVYYVIMPAEASTNLSRYDGVKYGIYVDGANLLDDYCKTRLEGFGREVRRRILLGTYVLSAGYFDAYYGKATRVRELIREDFNDAFARVDVIATPTAPTTAFRIGEKEDPLSMYLADIFTVPANIAGIPGISVPVASDSPLPVGIQLLARHECEETLFHVGTLLEKR